MLILTATDVAALFRMPEAFEAVEEAALAHVARRTDVPKRAAMAMTNPAVELLVMPGIVDRSVFGLKTWYAFSEEVPPLRRSTALMTLLVPELGLEVVLDAGVMTDLRTGAITGLAARRLAASARVAAVVGAGIQARTQALALTHACVSLATIRVSSRNPSRRARFVEALRAELVADYPNRGIEVVSAPTSEDACCGADVVVAATTSPAPVIKDEWLAEDVLVCGVGSHSPADAELEQRTVARASLIVADTLAGGVDGAGDISGPVRAGLVSRDAVLELGELLAPDTDVPEDGVKVFKSVGFAAADIVAAHSVARRAVAAGLGLRVDLHG